MKTEDRLDRWIPLRDAVRLFPKNSRGKRPHRSCLFRWAKYGKRGVMLRTWLAGPCLCTSRRAVFEFVSQLSEAAKCSTASVVDGQAEAAAAGDRLSQTVFRRHQRRSGGAQ